MRTLQFWILVIGSTLVCVLMLQQIRVSRAINHRQRDLEESQDLAAMAPTYERYWKALAVHIYQAGHDDPALAAVLKDAKVEIRTKPSATPSPGSTATPAPSTPAKAPVAP